jgi:hypothetical protein
MHENGTNYSCNTLQSSGMPGFSRETRNFNFNFILPIEGVIINGRPGLWISNREWQRPVNF